MSFQKIFQKWVLESPFRIELQKESPFRELGLRSYSLSIYIAHESEIPAEENKKFQFSKKIYGTLKTKYFYPEDATGQHFFMICPQNEPKNIFSDDAGLAHKASHYGSLLSILLMATPITAKEELVFSVTLSDEMKKQINGEQSEFLLGLLQRGISNKLKKSEKTKPKLVILEEGFWNKKHLFRAERLNESMSYTRSLVNMPGNVLNPATYETFIREMVKRVSKHVHSPNYIQIEVMNYDKLLSQNCGLISAVGKGSKDKPKIIKLIYHPYQTDGPKKHIVLVGKGITFDSGGYDIKPSAGMRHMKKDMGGSASCLGTFLACSALNLNVRITCYLAIAENMISNEAMRPGDVYLSRDGQSVEIDNTDAEGRLVLADTLTFAVEENPDLILDIATLTGAARVSLGPYVDSFFSNNKEYAKLFLQSAEYTGDWIWRVPLVKDYDGYLDSSVADMSNSSSSPYGGSITAALFLQRFVKKTPWCHIDSFMWTDRPHSLWNEGSSPTAKCVRLVTHGIESFAQKN